MLATRKGRTSVDKARPFNISKREVWLAYKRVRENRGAAGVDDQTIAEFEKDLSNNLYRLWNRMSSGSYMPPPVRRVDIPKGDGRGTRSLGIPTVSDRIAQMVVKRYLEPVLEPVFHDDSFGYRPGRSAHDALAAARQRCWRFDWVLDLDIKGFFDNIDWELLMRAVRRHTDCAWVLLYIERWLKAPGSMPDGALVSREKGTPQGAVVSPILANLFLHYAFDRWMKENNPDIPFERYADDTICHCRSEAQALSLRQALEARLAACKLELHPQKTKIVYCKDSNRPNGYPEQRFDFFGLYVSTPTIDESRWKAVRQFLSCGQRQSGQGDARRRAPLEAASSQRSRLGENRPMGTAYSCWLGQLLRAFSSFGASQGTAHSRSIYRALGTAEIQKTSGTRKASGGLVARGQIPPAEPVRPLVHEISGWGDRSRMSRETHVRFSEGVGVGFPRATRLSAGVRNRQRSAQLDRLLS